MQLLAYGWNWSFVTHRCLQHFLPPKVQFVLGISYTHGRKVGDVCTWTSMDLSRWKSIWTARAGAAQPPCSSVEWKLEKGKNSSHVFSTPGAWALFYWSRTIADYFHGDAGWEHILHPELPGYWGELEQGPTHFHHHAWKHVSVTLQVMGKRPCAPPFRHKWPLCPTDTSPSQGTVMLFTQQGLSCELLGKCPIYAYYRR